MYHNLIQNDIIKIYAKPSLSNVVWTVWNFLWSFPSFIYAQ